MLVCKSNNYRAPVIIKSKMNVFDTCEHLQREKRRKRTEIRKKYLFLRGPVECVCQLPPLVCMLGMLHTSACVYMCMRAWLYSSGALSASAGACIGKCHVSYLWAPEGLESLTLTICPSVSLLTYQTRGETAGGGSTGRGERLRDNTKGGQWGAWKRIGLCAYKSIDERESTRKDRDGEKKIHSMINYPHCVPEKRWGKRTVGTWGIHKDTGSIHMHTQSSSATKTYESLSNSVSESSLNPP